MLRLGVDFGTTNSVVALADVTGCQVVHHHFTLVDGPEIVEPVFPSIVATLRTPDSQGRDLAFGLAAEAIGRRAISQVRSSIKRELFAYHAGKTIEVGGRVCDLRETLTALLGSLLQSTRESLRLTEAQPELDVVATVPANANGAQRWITRRAFVEAGWGPKLRLIDEPTAAAIEFIARSLRRRRGQPPEPSNTLIYDLGGGTFDASLVQAEGERVEVLANGGIWKLGGDDFDHILADLVAENLGLDWKTLSRLQQRSFLAECRRLKESLASFPRPPRNLFISVGDLGIKGRKGSETQIDVGEYRKRLHPLLQSTLQVVEEVLDIGGKIQRPDRVYLVGGSTLLPFVPEVLRNRFPAVVRGSRPFESVAIGAALAHELAPGRLTHRLARHFGVLRVGGDDHGYEYVDVLFKRGTKLPLPGSITVVRRGPYRPYYDVGLLRYLECSTVTSEGKPGRNRRDWQIIAFPYAPSAPALKPRQLPPARRRDDLDILITEEYVLDSDGIISVRIQREPDGYSERHEVCG